MTTQVYGLFPNIGDGRELDGFVEPVLSCPGTHWAFVPHGFGLHKSSLVNGRHRVNGSPVMSRGQLFSWQQKIEWLVVVLEICSQKVCETCGIFSQLPALPANWRQSTQITVGVDATSAVAWVLAYAIVAGRAAGWAVTIYQRKHCVREFISSYFQAAISRLIHTSVALSAAFGVRATEIVLFMEFRWFSWLYPPSSALAALVYLTVPLGIRKWPDDWLLEHTKLRYRIASTPVDTWNLCSALGCHIRHRTRIHDDNRSTDYQRILIKSKFMFNIGRKIAT